MNKVLSHFTAITFNFELNIFISKLKLFLDQLDMKKYITFKGSDSRLSTKCPEGYVYCLRVGNCVYGNSCNDKRSLWIDKENHNVESVADGFKKQYYCSSLDAYVTNRKSCEIMTKFSDNAEIQGIGKGQLACGKGKVIVIRNVTFNIYISFVF